MRYLIFSEQGFDRASDNITSMTVLISVSARSLMTPAGRKDELNSKTWQDNSLKIHTKAPHLCESVLGKR